MNKEVFITNVTRYLPNSPVNNDEMEARLGLIGEKASRVKNIILRQNKIVNRFYAIDESGNMTHTNAQLTACAIRSLFDWTVNISLNDIQLLCCGTSSPDQLMPSHGSMVQGELGNDAPAVEVMTAAGVCCTSTTALKYGYMSVLSGLVRNAVCTGSELLSPLLLANKFESEYQSLKEVENNPMIAFEKDFLRFMLSDGAGACLLSDTPNKNGLSLRIEWIEATSFANELKPCMYQGAEKDADGNLDSWKVLPANQWLTKSVFAIKQDARYLGQHIIRKGGEHIINTLQSHNITAGEIDYILPHISSMFFFDSMKNGLNEAGYGFSDEKWFVNLPQVGNVGSASIYLMLAELFHSGRLQPGQKIYLFSPESSRFSYASALLTVV